MAQAALNTAVRFPVPSLSTDSYKIAATVDQAIAVAEKAGISDALPRPGSSGAGSAQP
jgi:hypothetical protein